MPDGKEKWLTDCSVPITDPHTGETIASLGILQDITDRKRQEESLREAHRIYRKAIDNAQGVPYQLDYATGQYVYVGEGCERLLGIPFDEITVKKVREMVIQNVPTEVDDPEDAMERDRLFREGNLKRYRADIHIITQTGEDKWLTDYSVPIEDPETGETTGSLGILQDITDRKRQEEKLKEAHKIYRRAIDLAQGVPYQLNYKTGQYDYVGEGCQELVGIPPNELTSKKFREMVIENIPTEEDQDPDPYVRDKEFREGKLKGYRADIKILTPEGEEKWLTDCSVPIPDPKTGEIVASLGILQDITDRKRSEQSVITTSRMEATATLAGGIAHDFNNLMVSVLGNAELLKMKFTGREDALDMLQSICQAAQRAGDLAQQMVAFARGGKYQPKNLNINDVISESLKLQESAFPSRIEVETELAEDLWTIEGDAAQMSQVILNLCLNAVDAIEGNGKIKIMTHNIELNETFAIGDLDLKQGNYICMSVSDTGRGISQEVFPKIFEPFTTTKFQGRGLGLAAVYGIVKNHNGDIQPHTSEGKGTVFKVFLPAIEAVAVSETTDFKGTLTGNETVLIIDDVESVLQVSRNFLGRFGYECILARDGVEAVEIAKTHEGDIHIAILDMGMPRMGGKEAYPLLMEARPDMKVVICSGYELDDASQSLLDSGASAFVQKPFQARVLLGAVREALDN